MALDIAWPRSSVYDSLATAGHGHWYWQWIAVLFIGIVIVVGAVWYFSVYARKPIEVIESHRADPQFDLRTPVGLGEMAP